MNIISRIFFKIKILINNCYWNFKIHIGKYSIIINPLKVYGSINIGRRVIIQKGCWIECNPLTNNPNPILEIGDGCVIGHYNEIFSTSEIILEDNVLTADRVYISDNLHGFEDINTPILRQPIIQNRSVRIGEGSWLGINVCVMGANVGRHCTIGANAVVTKDIPDYCVAVGSPAYIIKRYDFEAKEWRKTDKKGNFI